MASVLNHLLETQLLASVIPLVHLHTFYLKFNQSVKSVIAIVVHARVPEKISASHVILALHLILILIVVSHFPVRKDPI